MLNLINKFLKSIYVYIGFKLPYYWADIFFKNRVIYAAMLMSGCYTMRQFRNKNERLVNLISTLDDAQKYNIKSVRDVSNYLKSSLSTAHIDRTTKFIEQDLGIPLD